jgi:hypothetical protein
MEDEDRIIMERIIKRDPEILKKMKVKLCPRDATELRTETRVIHHENPNADYNRRHPGNPMIGGCLMPSDVPYLVCPLCGWTCESRRYDNAIDDDNIW